MKAAVVLVAALCACSGKSGEASLVDGAVSLTRVLAKGDTKGAKRLLVAPKHCEKVVELVPNQTIERCQGFMKEMHESLGEWAGELKGFEIKSAKEVPVPKEAPKSARMVIVEGSDGGDLDFAAIEIDGRFHYILPMKKKEVR